jgi:hypothetical protein
MAVTKACFQGMAESALVELRDKCPDALEVYIARIGLTFRKTTPIPNAILWVGNFNREDQLATALVDVAKNGFKTEILYVKDLNELGMK